MDTEQAGIGSRKKDTTEETMIRVVSFDPGITTGLATGRIKDGFMKTTASQDKWNHSELYAWLGMYNPMHIVCERFEWRRGTDKVELYSRELIGVINLYSQQYDVKLHMQMAGEVIGGFYDNGKLKADNLYKPGQPHAMDALRHLLFWYTFKAGYQFNQHGYG